MSRFYIGKTLQLVGISSLGGGLLVGVGNHTQLAAPMGAMSPERAMWIELFLFLAGMAVFSVGRYVERRA